MSQWLSGTGPSKSVPAKMSFQKPVASVEPGKSALTPMTARGGRWTLEACDMVVRWMVTTWVAPGGFGMSRNGHKKVAEWSTERATAYALTWRVAAVCAVLTACSGLMPLAAAEENARG